MHKQSIHFPDIAFMIALVLFLFTGAANAEIRLGLDDWGGQSHAATIGGPLMNGVHDMGGMLTALIEQMVKSGLVTCAEIERVTPAPGSPKLTPALTPDKVLPLIARGAPDSRNIPAIARFQTGQSVRVDNLNPAGHTRLPRYARGKIGTVERVTASSSFRTTTPFSSARSPSIYIRCAFPRANYLATKPRRKMGFIYRSVG